MASRVGAERAFEPDFAGTGRFEVRGELGRGAVGVVYEVFDRERNARLALKSLRTLSADTILLLKNEFRVVQDLNHPNLVTLHELFEEHGRWFFTMEYVQGETFLAHVRDELGFDEAKLRSALGQLVRGLAALHGGNKVHRDIKPTNVLVTPQGRVVILDFGIVSELGRSDADREGLVGTVPYMAPEQAAGEAVGPPTDWYAVGTVLYQALTGVLPFEGSIHHVLAQKIVDLAPSPRALVPDLPQDLADLCVDLLKLDPAERPTGIEILKRLGMSASVEVSRTWRTASFVGRRKELARIEEAFEEVASGRAVTVLVAGESGVGKSFLVREFTQRAARREDVLIFRGRCYERESVPYKAVDGVIDDVCRYLGSLPNDEAAMLLPEQAGLLRRLFPVLDGVPVLAEARITQLEVQNPQEIRARVFAILRTLFANLAKDRKIVVVIDDLQWADTDSLALLSEVLLPPNEPPLLLLATMRSQTETRRRGDGGLVDAITRLPGIVHHVHVEPLPAADARELVGQLLQQSDNDVPEPSAVESILAEAKGHPLFLDELARHRHSHKRKAAPTRLDDALWERASQLAPQQLRLLELVAVAGVPMAQDTIARAAALDFGQAFALVSALRAGHFVRTSRVERSDTIEPYHDRVRESVLARLDEAAKREWHARLAVALEQSEDRDPEMLLTHWRGADNASRAAEYAIVAADQASAALAFDHAASLYRTALDFAPKDGGDDRLRELRVKLAEALTNAGRGADGARTYLEAARGAPPNVALDLKRRAAEQYMCSGHLDEGAATFDAVLEEAEISTPKSPAAVLFSLIFYSLVLAIRGLGFTRREERDVDPRELLRLDCLYSAGCGLGMQDHVRGKAYQVRTVIASLRVGEPMRVARALGFFAAANASGGVPSYEKTMRLQGAVDVMAKSLNQPYPLALSSAAAGYGYFFNGDWKKAKDALVRAEEIWRDQCVGVTYEINSVRLIIGRALGFLGELSDLAKRAEANLREAEQRGDLYSIVNVRSSALSLLALFRDDPEDSQREIDLATRHLSTRGFFVQHFYCLLAQVNVSLYRGDAAKAEADIAARWGAIKRSMLLHVQSLRILLFDARARACTALARAGGDEGKRALAAAERHVRALEKENTSWSKPQAMLARVGICHLRGEADAAVAHAAAAEAAFEAADLPIYAAAARRRRGMLVPGEEGRALRTSAELSLRARGISDPAKLTAWLSPGFEPETT